MSFEDVVDKGEKLKQAGRSTCREHALLDRALRNTTRRGSDC